MCYDYWSRSPLLCCPKCDSLDLSRRESGVVKALQVEEASYFFIYASFSSFVCALTLGHLRCIDVSSVGPRRSTPTMCVRGRRTLNRDWEGEGTVVPGGWRPACAVVLDFCPTHLWVVSPPRHTSDTVVGVRGRWRRG